MCLLQGKELDKSTWFTVDKKLFRVKTEELSTTIRSSYSGGGSDAAGLSEHLVIISENLPKSLETDEVSVELLSSNLKDAVVLEGDSVDTSTNDGYLEGILKRERSGTASTKTSAVTTYYNKHSGHLYWAVWLKAGYSVTIPFKYKITWPDERNIQMV